MLHILTAAANDFPDAMQATEKFYYSIIKGLIYQRLSTGSCGEFRFLLMLWRHTESYVSVFI